MKLDDTMKWLGYICSLFVLIFGFLLFYSDTNAMVGSLVAAILSAALVFGAFLTIRWLVEVFTKK